MAIGYLDSQKLTNIADSIRTKLGVANTYTVDQMPTAIQSIPAPSAPRVFKDVNFFDWDGTILYSYTLAEAQALSALPALPTPPAGYEIYDPGDGSNGWTETLSYIQNLTMPCDVGVNYRASDSNPKTKIYIEIPYNGAVVVTRGDTGVRIDWGDGSSEEAWGDDSVHKHTYAQAGTYTIQIRNTYYNRAPKWPYNGYGPCFVLESEAATAMQSSDWTPTAKYSLITGVEFAGNAWTNVPSFTGNYRITELILPTNAFGNIGASEFSRCFSGTGIKHLTIPSSSRLLYGQQYVSNMLRYAPYESVVFPSRAVQRTSSIQFYRNDGEGALNLRRIVIDAGSNTISYAYKFFYKHNALEEYYIRGSFSVTPSSFSSDCPNLRKASLIGLNNANTGEYAFTNDSFLERANLPGVTTIDMYAFQNTSIKNIDLSQVSIFSNSAFQNTLLESVNLSNATSIGLNAFYSCHCLHEVTIGPNVTSIEGEAFRYCHNLHNVYIEATTPPTLGIIAFSDAASDLTIYVPAGTLAAYQSATNWSSYASQMQESFEITNYKSLTLSTTATPDGWDEYCPATATLVCDGIDHISGQTLYDQTLTSEVSCYIGENDTGSSVTKTISYTWPNSGLTATTTVTQGIKTPRTCEFTATSLATGWDVPNSSWPGDSYRLPDGSGYTSYIKQYDTSATNSCYLEIEFSGFTTFTFYVHCHAGENCYVKLDSMVTDSNYDHIINERITTSASATDITDTSQWLPITYSNLSAGTHNIYIYQAFNPTNQSYGEYCASVAVDSSLLTN